MAAHRSKNPKRPAAKQPDPVPGGPFYRRGHESVPVASGELGYYATTLARWLSTQDLIAAEALMILGGTMVAICHDTWPKDEDRPERIQAFLAELTRLGDLLAHMILLHKADPEAMYGDLGRS